MDKMCKKSEQKDLNKSVKTEEETDKERCGSPVFKCVTQTKPVRESCLDSSDYDLPSYQVNQSIKSRASSKYGNETIDSVLPFSPIFTPIPVAPAPQFQPPSIHSLGTVGKNVEKLNQNKVNAFSVCNKKEVLKSGGIFESLGVLDKDISWVSSMASPPPKQIPGSELNTVEKATFLPEENFQSIQPRALFSPTFDDDFGCQPIVFTSESDDDDDDDEPYKSNVRLSDVCATLKQLEVKSLEQMSNSSMDKILLKEDCVISPVIRTKKKKLESLKKKKKGALVVSPQEKDNYEFSVGENLKVIEPDKIRTNDGTHFIEDDSFQSMSFSCIDELCKTLVSEQSDFLVTSKTSECDKTLVNGIDSNSRPCEILKKFYSSKVETSVHSVSSIDNLHSNIKALEEGNKYIPTGGKIDQCYTNKGIMTLDAFNMEPPKSDATKRLHSELAEEKDESIEKKFKKVDDENSGWENVKQYLSESQLNVSDGEIFKTVENLEKTLASQEKKVMEKLSGKSLQDEEGSASQNSTLKASAESSAKSQEQKSDAASTSETVKDSFKGVFEMNFPAFTTASGSKISVSEKALSKAREILKDCDENLEDFNTKEPENRSDVRLQFASIPERSFVGFSTCSGKEIKVSAEALAKAKAFMLECEVAESSFKPDQTESKELQDKFGEGLANNVSPASTNQKESVEASVPAVSDDSVKKHGVAGLSSDSSRNSPTCEKIMEKEESFVLKNADQQEGCLMKGFTTGSGKAIKVSAESLKKAKALMLECDEENIGGLSGILQDQISSGAEPKIDEHLEKLKPAVFKGFSTGSGKLIQISDKALEKAKTFMNKCENEFNENFGGLTSRNEEPVGVETCDKFEVKKDFEAPVIGFSTALGKKVEVSSEALEKAKALWAKSEEGVLELSDLGKPPPTVPAEGRSKAAALEKHIEAKETKVPRLSQNSVDCTRMKTPTKNIKISNREEETDKQSISGVDESDWEEIIPSWLHTYTTSPSMTADVLELSPVIADEDGKSSKPYKEYIKSPVLGTSDRFYGKAKRQKLKNRGDNKNQNATSDMGTSRKGNAKRTLNLDFSAPFKKIKVKDDFVNVDVKEERKRAREEQDKLVREKQKVKPLEGSHLRKKRSEKQMSWMEAVGKSSPQAHSNEFLKSLGLSEDVLRVNIQNSAAFRFNGEHYFGSAVCLNNTKGIPAGDDCVIIIDDENNLGVEEIKRAFLASPGVQPNLLPHGWVENHYKWIVWKLAHYERSFPLHFGGNSLTPNQVLLQLKYRYDREIDRNERSALKKILERDDSSIKRLVLCVCGIKKVAGSETTGFELEVTDGWYSCPARTDVAMTRLIEEGKVFVGMKIMTQGAVLVNCEQGMSPLEITEGVYLRISTNSTRRVRWDTKLGFQKIPENFPISLGSILPQGGQISRVDVIIVRVYPLLYMEKTDGHHVTRNRRAEEKADAEYRRIQEQKMEIIYDEIRTEMRRSTNSEKKANKNSLKDMEIGGDFNRLMEEPLALQNLLMTDQKKLIEKLQSNERFSRELVQKIEKEKIKKRIVSQFLRVKVVDFRKPDYNNPALLSVWNPNEDLTSLLTEGKVVSMMNITINNSSRLYKPLQINTTRQTQFRPIAKSVKYPARKLMPLKSISPKICPAFEEVDLVGMITLIQDVSYGSRLSQVVYLTDLEMNFVGIVFWGSCKDFGWENVLRVKSIVACSNLQWKKNYTLQDVPSVYVNENSVFTENPKQDYLKEEIERLKQNLPQDKTEFLSKCEEELTTKLEDSKWRTNTSKNSSNDSSLRENQIARPQTPKLDGFESKPTASSTPIKPFTFRSNSDDAEPSPIQKRIEKLQCYGEPSSLIPLLIRNNMKRKFKKKTKPLNNQSESL